MTAAARRIAWNHPEAAAALVAAAAWAVLAAPVLDPAVGDLHASAHAGVPVLAAAVGWLTMVAAMMVPAALPAARQLGLNALWARRGRTMALFLAAYVGVWAAFGAVVLPLVALAGGGSAALDASSAPLAVPGVGALDAPSALLAAALALAAAWSLTPWKWRAVRACHRVTPLPPRSDAACVRAGVVYGRRCVVSCWPLMAAMAIAGHTALALMVLGTVVVLVERAAMRPGELATPVAATLAGAALVAALVG